MAFFIGRPELQQSSVYAGIIEQVIESQRLSNFGPQHEMFRTQLGDTVAPRSYVNLVTNATVALELILQLIPSGEILVTPFSYVATLTPVLKSKNHRVKFVDISDNSPNMSSEQLQSVISDQTVAVICTQCYGDNREIENIVRIAKGAGIISIVDSAHSMQCFNQELNIFEIADIHFTSFHATKIFNTTEGGAIFTREFDYHSKLEDLISLQNFTELAATVPTNAKLNEISCAMGNANLLRLNEVVAKRRSLLRSYAKMLSDTRDVELLYDKSMNGSYVTCTVDALKRDLIIDRLARSEIHCRKYFYPSLNTYFKGADCPESEKLAGSVIALPIHSSMSEFEVEFIVNSLKDAL